MGLAERPVVPGEARGLGNRFCVDLVVRVGFSSICPGHPIEVGHAFIEQDAAPTASTRRTAARGPGAEPMPWLAALALRLRRSTWPCTTPTGVLLGLPTYQTYNARFMQTPTSRITWTSAGRGVRRPFRGAGQVSRRLPRHFCRPESLPAWHLVGGKDPLDESELTGSELNDRRDTPYCSATGSGRDGLTCLKV